jgi:hypothetical protein
MAKTLNNQKVSLRLYVEQKQVVPIHFHVYDSYMRHIASLPGDMHTLVIHMKVQVAYIVVAYSSGLHCMAVNSDYIEFNSKE